ncbi:MAG: hypothetical protein ACRDA4_02880 [Filifactoraceae bacterium]
MDNCCFKMEVPKQSDFLVVIRFSIMALAEKLGFGFDDVEDIKIAFTEASKIFLVGSKKESFNIDVKVDDKVLSATFSDTDFSREALTVSELQEIKIGVYVIDSLMDESEIYINNNACKTVKLKKLR